MTTESFILDALRWLLPIGLSAYALFSQRSREERKAQDKQLADLLLFRETQHARNEGLVASIEKLGGEMLSRHRDNDSKLSEVSKMREEIIRMSTELKHHGQGFSKLENKLDTLFKELRDQKK